MSQVIDNQIVKMQFDNSNFEKNAQESMSTLDKLKQALKFDKVDMTPLQKAFNETEATATKAGFNIRDIWLKVASTIETEVANKIVSTGKKIANALTFEGVMDGFSEYELKMGSIQTIMAGTGESLATVNRYLDELNKYSDQTIYSFSDMTNNIGKFTNAGVKLDDAVNAIKGIANEAAISGANANEASRAMYNFAQALSAGYVKLIDWKSIENANMATKGFKEALLEVGVACGTVAKSSDGMYKILTQNNQGKTMADAVSGTKNFNDSLQYQWMTTEVLTKTLKLYATDVRTLTDAQKEAYEAELKKLGLDDEQIKKFEELGIKATDAASEIKTFSMLMDTLKEAIGSGWAMTWQIIIGDFEQAKELWTEVGGVLGGLIDSMSDARNAFLSEGLETGWERFITLEGMAIPQTENFREVLVGLAQDHKLLTSEQAGAIDSTSDLIKSFHELGWVTGDLLTEAVSDYYNILKSMNSDELAEMGISETEISELEQLNKALADGTINADEFAESMNKLGGRENVIAGLKNLFESLVNVLKPIGDAFNEVFGVMDPKNLYDLTERFRLFTEQLKVTEDASNTLHTAFTLAFGGIKTIIGTVTTAIKGLVKLILPLFNLFDAIFGLIGKVVSALTGSQGALDVADKFSKIGDKISDKYLWAMQKLADFINKVAEAIRGIPDAVIFTKIHDAVESTVTTLQKMWESFTNLPIVQQMVADFWDAVAKAQATIEPIIDSIQSKLEEFGTSVESKMNWDTVNSVLTTVYSKFQSFLTIISNFATRIKTFFTGLREGKSVVDSFKESFGDIIDKIKDLKKNAEDFFKSLFDKGDELGDKFNLDKISQAIHEFVANITPEQITLLAVAATFMLIALNLMRLSDAIRNAIDSFAGIGMAIKNVINSYVKKQKSVILQIAESIVIVAAALWVLSTVPQDKLQNAVSALITITICLGALTAVLTVAGILMNKLGGGQSMVKMASALAIIAGALATVALTLKLLEYVNVEGVLPKVLAILGIMSALIVMSGIMARLNRFSRGTLTLLAISASLLIASVALRQIGEIESDKIENAVEALLKIMIGLAAVTFAAGKVGIPSVIGLIAVVFAMKKILPAIEEIVNYDYTKMEEGIEKNKEILRKLGLLVGVMVVVGALAGNRLKGTAIALLAVSGTFAILLGICKLAGMLKPQELSKGEKFLWSMAGIIALIELCSRKAMIGIYGGKDRGEGSKMFIRIAVAMGIMLGIAKLASMMDAKDIVKGELAVLGLVGLVLAMVVVSKHSAGSKDVIKNISSMLFALSLILAEVAILSMVPLGQILPAVGIVLAILGALALLALSISKNSTIFDKATHKKASTLAGLLGAMVAVVLLGAILWQLSKEPIGNVAAAGTALVGVIAAVALVAVAIGRLSKVGNINIAPFFIAVLMVAAVAGILAGVSKYLSKNNIDPSVMIKAAAGIAIVLAALTPALLALSLFKGNSNYAAMAEAAGLAIGALIAVAASIGLLSRFGGTNVIDSAVAIAIGLIAICVPIIVLGAVGEVCRKVKISAIVATVIGAIASLAAVATAIIAVSNMGNPDTILQSAQALAIGLIAISIPIAVLGAVGLMCNKIGGGGLAAMGVAVVGAIVALGAVAAILVWFSQNIDEGAINTLNAAIPILVTAMAGISIMALAIAAAGLICQSVTAALAGGVVILEAIVAFGVIIAAIIGLGALINEFEAVGPALETGLDYLVIIFEKIGEAVGSLISGFTLGLTSDLGPIGDNLIEFSEKMVTFSDNMAKVNEKAVEGCKNIAAAMLFICGAEFLEGITTWLGFKTGSNLDFGPIGEALVKFCDAIKDVPDEVINKANTCSIIAKRLAEMVSTLGNEGGVVSWFIGKKKDLGDFGEGVAKLGESLKKFCDAVKEVPEDAVNLAQRAAEAAGPMVDFSQTLMNTGGLVQKIIGEKDLGGFGQNLETFVTGLVSFVEALKVLEETAPDYPDLIRKCADATEPMVDLAAGIENSGGRLAEWLGENTLDVFGETLTPFAEGLKSFVTVLKALSTEVPNFGELISATADATIHLVTLANNLENMGGVASAFTGDNTLDRFGETLSDFGVSLAEYASSVNGISTSMLDAASTSVEKIIALSKDAVNVPTDALYGIRESLISLSDIAELDIGDPSVIIGQIETLFAGLKNFASTTAKEDAQVYMVYGSSMVSAIISGINLDYPRLVERLNNMVRSIFTLLTNLMAADKFKIYGKNIINGIIMGINEAYPTLEQRLRNMVTAIHNLLKVIMAETEFKIYGKNIDTGIIAGIDEKEPDLLQAVRDLVDGIIAIIDDKLSYQDGYDIGWNFVEGVADGIRDNDNAASAAHDMAEGVNNETSNTLEEHSPSKVGYRIGKYFDLGVANGISDYASTVASTSETMAEGVINRANDIVSAIQTFIDSDMDTQPTIRPVLDTSDISEQAKNIGRLFNSSDLQLAYDASGTIKHMSEERSEDLRRSREAADKANTEQAQPNQINFTQNNYSPKPLSRVEIYRDTKNTLSMMKGVVAANG